MCIYETESNVYPSLMSFPYTLSPKNTCLKQQLPCSRITERIWQYQYKKI